MTKPNIYRKILASTDSDSSAFESTDSAYCCLTQDVAKNPIKTDCGHIFELSALVEYTEKYAQTNDDTIPCPNCREDLSLEESRIEHLQNQVNQITSHTWIHQFLTSFQSYLKEHLEDLALTMSQSWQKTQSKGLFDKSDIETLRKSSGIKQIPEDFYLDRTIHFIFEHYFNTILTPQLNKLIQAILALSPAQSPNQTLFIQESAKQKATQSLLTLFQKHQSQLEESIKTTLSPKQE